MGYLLGLARRLLLLVLLAQGAGALALDSPVPKFYELGQAQGFAGDRVNCILQDKRGLLWFGALGGLYCYDGHAFTNWLPGRVGNSLTSSLITALLEDDKGTIWVASDGGGIARLELASDRITTYGWKDGLAPEGAMVKALALCMDERGRLVVGMGDGLVYRWDPGERRFLPLARLGPGREAITCLLVDFQGQIWAGTAGGGLLLYDEDGLALAEYRHRPGEAASLGSDWVRALFEDSLGSLWIGLGDGGVDLVLGRKFRHCLAQGRKPRLGAAQALAEDTEGKIWVGFSGGGIGGIDPASLEMALPSQDGPGVGALFRDRSGIIWAGLVEGGIRAYNLRTSPFFLDVKGPLGTPLQRVRGLAETASGRVLVSTKGAGLFSVDPREGRAQAFRGLPAWLDPSGVRTMAFARDATLWLGTESQGLVALGKDGTDRAYRLEESQGGGLGREAITAILEDGDGGLWVGTQGLGLYRLAPRRGSLVRDGDLPWKGGYKAGSSVSCLLRDKAGDLWVGYADGGLARLPKDGRQLEPFGLPGQPLLDTCVTTILEDSGGGLWLGTGGLGVLQVDRERGRATRLEGEEGLVGTMVYAIVEDEGGILWISSSSGLTAYDRARGDFYLLGAEDGLSTGRLDRGSSLLSRDGELWVGGQEGLVRFDPLLIPRYAPAPEVVIAGVDLLGGGQPHSRSADGLELVLDHANKGLSFHIAVSDYSAPSRNQYAMRLEGRQDSWLSLGGSNSGYIAPLGPGHYMLRVKGSNGNGIWNDYGASLSIVVLPPFWATWYFRLIVAAALLGLAGLGLAARLGALRRRNSLLVKFARHIEDAREEERKLAARDVHDEIGQHLTVLNFHAYWLVTHQASPEDERISRIKVMQGVILDAMGAVKAVATGLRPAALDALDFAGALRWYIRSFKSLSGMAVDLEEDWGACAIQGELTTALFRILQEILGNVMRHSAAHGVRIWMGCDGELAILDVADDGVGIDPAQAVQPDSFGIIGMRERCAAFGGSLEILAPPGGGTRIVARLRITPSPAGARRGRKAC